VSALLQLYHRLPSPLRSVVATMRGYQLRSWRYGHETEDEVARALERERWPREKLRAWQQELLARALHRAATTVPYYREQWAKRRRAGDRASAELLANWPLLTKEELRDNPRAFIADDRDPRRMFHEHTSGTTGKPLNLWFTRKTLRAYYAIYEARIRRRYGVSLSDRWANIGGQQVVPFEQTEPPFWVWNAALHQLYMSSYHLAAQFVPAYFAAMREHGIVYALGYSSSLYSLAQLALELGCDAPPLTTVVSNAEPLFDYQRATISAAFKTKARQTYGMCEISCAASDCEHDVMHLWPEVGVLEVWADHGDTPVEAGTVGRLVCTNLLNLDMPLVRYEVGDRGALRSDDDACACGRTLPALASVEGRMDDVLVTADGRRIGRLDPVFKSDLPIREAQIIQEAVSRVRIRLVPTPEYSAKHGEVLARALRERMGDIEVLLEPVDHIARTSNGKFRAVINQISPKVSA
jgi:phenylacetate-CoA ligase